MITQEEYEQVEKLIIKILDKEKIVKDVKYMETLILGKKLEQSLIDSVKKDNFKMLYQPKLLDGKQIVGAEALFRTNESIKIRPDVAFTLFKLFGDEKEVVLKQLEVISKDTSKFKDEIDPNFKTTLNVALDCLDEDFVKKLDKVVAKNGLKYKNIGIEILESENFKKIDDKREIIEKLQKNGVSFALDDFGSREANDSALNKMKFDTIKFDSGFLKSKKHNDLKNEITEKSKLYPNMEIVIEGVEYIEDVEFLNNISGHKVQQGYYFDKPIEADKLIGKYSQMQSQPGQ